MKALRYVCAQGVHDLKCTYNKELVAPVFMLSELLLPNAILPRVIVDLWSEEI